jgi:hypothetical protein
MTEIRIMEIEHKANEGGDITALNPHPQQDQQEDSSAEDLRNRLIRQKLTHSHHSISQYPTEPLPLPSTEQTEVAAGTTTTTTAAADQTPHKNHHHHHHPNHPHTNHHNHNPPQHNHLHHHHHHHSHSSPKRRLTRKKTLNMDQYLKELKQLEAEAEEANKKIVKKHTVFDTFNTIISTVNQFLRENVFFDTSNLTSTDDGIVDSTADENFESELMDE